MKTNDRRQRHILVSMKIRFHKMLCQLKSCRNKTCITWRSYGGHKNFNTMVVNWISALLGKGHVHLHKYEVLWVGYHHLRGEELVMLKITEDIEAFSMSSVCRITLHDVEYNFHKFDSTVCCPRLIFSTEVTTKLSESFCILQTVQLSAPAVAREFSLSFLQVV